MFTIREVLPSILRGLRYKNKLLQDWWSRSIKEEIGVLRGEIAFFEGLAMRHFSDRLLSERISEILDLLKDKKLFLENALQNGDYPREQNASH